MTGPGKYDPLCTAARESAQAQCAILIIVGGKHGNGFSMQCTSHDYIRALPHLLRQVATEIEQEAKG